MTVSGTLAERLRYGENPHQTAAVYADGERPLASLVGAAWQGDSDSQWVGQLRFSFLLVFMTCFFYFMLGLVAELAVKASQMHRGQSARVLVREGHQHG